MTPKSEMRMPRFPFRAHYMEMRGIMLSSGVYENGDRTPFRNLQHEVKWYPRASKIKNSFTSFTSLTPSELPSANYTPLGGCVLSGQSIPHAERELKISHTKAQRHGEEKTSWGGEAAFF